MVVKKSKKVAPPPAPPPAPAPRRKGQRREGPEHMCWARLRRFPDRHCRQPKGFKTPHVGSGRCWLHGGLTPIKTGLHSLIKHERLKDLIAKLEETDQQLMDLEPEAKLMRAMVIDYVNRYDDFVDQLETWYTALDSERRDAGLPPLPHRIPELEGASQLIEAISRIVERQHKITREGSITLDVFRGLMTQMGLIVAKHVTDDKMLNAIERDWKTIMVDPKSFVRGGHPMAVDETDDERTPDGN